MIPIKLLKVSVYRKVRYVKIGGESGSRSTGTLGTSQLKVCKYMYL